VQVTVEGALTKEGHFEATLVMAKCSSKYDPSTHEMSDKGEAQSTPIN
jgi:cytochrome c-type biogenesis protein CcmE